MSCFGHPLVFCKNYIISFYRTPKTLGWPTKDASLDPISHQDKIFPSLANLFHILQLLPHFFPSDVRALISDFKIEDSSGLSFFYTFEAFTHLQQLGIRSGTSSTSHPYDWPPGWGLNGFTCILESRSFLAPIISTHSALLALLLDLGSYFTLPLFWRPTDTSQGYSSPLSQVSRLSTPLSVSKASLAQEKLFLTSTVLTAEPNLSLPTAIEIIDTLLQDASKNIRDQYARCLANQVKVLPARLCSRRPLSTPAY